MFCQVKLTVCVSGGFKGVVWVLMFLILVLTLLLYFEIPKAPKQTNRLMQWLTNCKISVFVSTNWWLWWLPFLIRGRHLWQFIAYLLFLHWINVWHKSPLWFACVALQFCCWNTGCCYCGFPLQVKPLSSSIFHKWWQSKKSKETTVLNGPVTVIPSAQLFF